MSDGTIEPVNFHGHEPSEGAAPYRAVESARPRLGDAAATTPLDLAAIAEWLPRLGTVLWLERREALPPAPLRLRAESRLLLLEHAAAGAPGCAPGAA